MLCVVSGAKIHSIGIKPNECEQNLHAIGPVMLNIPIGPIIHLFKFNFAHLTNTKGLVLMHK